MADEKTTRARTPLMEASSNMTKAIQRQRNLYEQLAKARGRVTELEEKMKEAEKDASSARAAFEAAAK